MTKVDFANEYTGGGVLGRGSVQEELRFLMSPELILSRLFTEKLTDEECLVITGFQRFSNISGYSYNFQWAGNHEDTIPIDEPTSQRLVRMVAMDATQFLDPEDQYKKPAILRELNKAFVGFYSKG